jgi:acyl-CoA thioester hydrolase
LSDGLHTDLSGSNSEAWPDLAGRLNVDERGQFHVLPVRVYFEDTDFSGLVYHASYVRWCERGRSDFLRLLGNNHSQLMTGGTGREPSAFVVRRMAFDYRKPARIDDVLEIETRAASMTAASLTLLQVIKRDGQTLCEADVTVVLVSHAGKPMRLGPEIRTAVAPHFA